MFNQKQTSKLMLAMLLCLGYSLAAGSTVFDDKPVSSKKAAYQEHIQQKTRKLDDEEKMYYNYEKFTSVVYNDIRAASGRSISNTDQFDFKQMKTLLRIKLSKGNDYPISEQDLKANTDSVRCITGLGSIIVPEVDSYKQVAQEMAKKEGKEVDILDIKDPELPKEGRTLEDIIDERDNMTEEQLQREIEIFTKIYEAHKANIELEIRSIKEYMAEKRKEQEKDKKTKSKRLFKKAGTAALFISKLQLQMKKVIDEEQAKNISKCSQGDAHVYAKIVKRASEIKEVIEEDIHEETQEIEEQKIEDEGVPAKEKTEDKKEYLKRNRSSVSNLMSLMTSTTPLEEKEAENLEIKEKSQGETKVIRKKLSVADIRKKMMEAQEEANKTHVSAPKKIKTTNSVKSLIGKFGGSIASKRQEEKEKEILTETLIGKLKIASSVPSSCIKPDVIKFAKIGTQKSSQKDDITKEQCEATIECLTDVQNNIEKKNTWIVTKLLSKLSKKAKKAKAQTKHKLSKIGEKFHHNKEKIPQQVKA